MVKILDEIEIIRDDLKNQRIAPNSNDSLFLALSDKALGETIELIQAEMSDALVFKSSREILKYCVNQSKNNAFYLEFGVFSGRTINYIAKLKPNEKIIGFDSFRGLPEKWSGWEDIDFNRDGVPPEVEKNVSLQIGWFEETLPEIKKELTDIAFIHIDCDIYTSTKTIFNELKDKIKPGCIILFDEYFCYPNFQKHEKRAFDEFLVESSLKADWIAICGQRAACRIT